jgi:acyl-CoA reductase-like NAD-dependent aldehyde dehydrogenase
MADALLAPYAATNVPLPPQAPASAIDGLVATLAAGQKRWNATPVEARRRAGRAADALQRRLPQCCARIVRKAGAPGAMPFPKCARRSTSAATTRRRHAG